MNTFLILWLVSLFIKVIIACLFPLSADESYYWVWAQNLQLSYFDHPPGVAILLWLGKFTDFFQGGVRIPAVLLGHCTLLIWYKILQKNFSFENLNAWLVAALLSPLIGFGSLIVTPDIAVMFFWSLSVHFFLRALNSRKSLDYLLFGCSFGLGFSSKYHIVLLGLAILLYLSLEKKWKAVSWTRFVLTLLGMLTFAMPVILWNYQNDFESFRFQMHHGFGASRWDPLWTVSYVLGQAFLLFPLLIPPALKARPTNDLKFLIYLTWVPLLFFAISSFRGVVEANWPIVAYPSFIALALIGSKNLKPLRIFALTWGLIGAFVVSNAFYPWSPVVPDKLNELHGYDNLVEKFREQPEMYASSYQMASVVWNRTRNKTYKLNHMSRRDFFDTFAESKPQTKSFLLARELDQELPEWLTELAQAGKLSFEIVESVPPRFEIVRVGFK